ncbi:MAG: S41 family peptidase [Verrucomicrobiales bacterium]|nr:S41 family peptidase [Verrucomicrobiales bacterium]
MIPRHPLSLLLALCSLASFPILASTELIEIQRLVSTNLPALSPDQLAAPTVDELLARLAPRVRWTEPETHQAKDPAPVTAPRRHDGNIGYIQLTSISGDADTRLSSALDDLQKEGALQGLVLDLRFAGGRDFGASARVSSLFLSGGEPVLDWGDGVFAAPGRSNHFSAPVAVLVNSHTRGAAEALAAALRSAGRAVVVGDRTAGEASQMRDFTLSTGRVLRLAVAPVRTGDGQPIATEGLSPDIRVTTPAEAERRFVLDPFAAPPGSAAGPSDPAQATSGRRRVSEAELIRNKRQSLGLPDLPQASDPEHAPQTGNAARVQDPALARGLDFVTGLNAVRN